MQAGVCVFSLNAHNIGIHNSGYFAYITGRQSRATCPYGVYNDPNMNTNCKALTDDVANAIAWQCVGLNSCSITAHAAFLGNMALPGGDPCSGK